MRICERCGRPLNDGEVCNCSAQAVPHPQSAPQPTPVQPAPQPMPGQPAPQPMPGQPAPQPMPGQPAPQPMPGQPAPQPMPGQPAPQPMPGQPAPQPMPGQPAPQPMPGQPIPGYPYPPQEEQPKKSGAKVGCIIAACVIIPIVLVIVGVLAAILVPSMIGYTKKANVSSANSAAKSIYDAANTAIVDFDSEGTDISGNFIFCSDASCDVNLPVDHNEFAKKMETYFSDSTQYDYFVVVEDYQCTYVACQKTGKNVIGGYPNPGSIDSPPVLYSGYYSDKDDTINDLYQNAADNLPTYYDYSYDDDDYSYDWDNYDWDDYDYNYNW